MIVVALAVPFAIGTLLLLFRGFVSGRVAAMLGAAAMAVSLVLYAFVWEGRTKVSGEVDTSWIEPLGARLHLGVTYISWPFLLMTALADSSLARGRRGPAVLVVVVVGLVTFAVDAWLGADGGGALALRLGRGGTACKEHARPDDPADDQPDNDPEDQEAD